MQLQAFVWELAQKTKSSQVLDSNSELQFRDSLYRHLHNVPTSSFNSAKC